MIRKFLFVSVVSFVFAVPAFGFATDVAPVIKTAGPAPVVSEHTRHSELAARRAAVAKALDEGSVLILFSAPSRIYANDVDYVYRQENNLFYLTEIGQNGISLVISKTGGAVETTLFVPKRNPRFEAWNGRMISNEEAQSLSGIDRIVDAADFEEYLLAVKGKTVFSKDGISVKTAEKVFLMQGDEREYGSELDFAGEIGDRFRSALPIFSRLRMIKSPYELANLQFAVDITSEALMRSMGMVGRAKYEYEVHAEVEYTYRRRNADFWGFPSIVGCGPNATTLHYVESQGAIDKGDLMLMDIGAEYRHYTADITRTFPVDGKFTKEQAEIYQIVYDAQNAAAARLKPGARMSDASAAARNEVMEGLFRLGLITERDPRQVGIWFMHGWGHWLGMNVHDVATRDPVLEPGMVMTNEPGIYIRADALDYFPDEPKWNEFKKKVRPAFEKYKNIGVRIEDDMLITRDGVDWMTKALPRSISEIESFMSKASKEMIKYAVTKPSRNVPDGNFAEVLESDYSAGFEKAVFGVSMRRRLDPYGAEKIVHAH